MIEIAAAIIGVVLAAIIGLAIKNHRSFVTFEIVSAGHDVRLHEGKIIPVEQDGGERVQLTTYRLEIVNRGWKNVRDAKLFAEAKLEPSSVQKSASSIGPQTISFARVGDGLVLSIDYLPAKEVVELKFLAFEPYARLRQFAGAGDAYTVVPLAYYEGFRRGFSALKSIAIFVLIFTLGGAVIGMVISEPPDATSAAVDMVAPTQETGPTGNESAEPK